MFTLSCLILLIYISTVSANATESLSNEEDYTGDASHLHYERTDNFEEEYEEEDDEALEEVSESNFNHNFLKIYACIDVGNNQKSRRRGSKGRNGTSIRSKHDE